MTRGVRAPGAEQATPVTLTKSSGSCENRSRVCSVIRLSAARCSPTLVGDPRIITVTHDISVFFSAFRYMEPSVPFYVRTG